MWENSLEKLKILNYESEYCVKRGKRPLSRIHFVFPGQNLSNQFDDYMDLCGWLCAEISNDPNLFKRDPFDDPNTAANKLMLALRKLDCRLSFPAQKMKTAYGEPVCSVLDFLTDKALAAKKFRWSAPIYTEPDKTQVADADDDADMADIEDEVDGAVDEEILFQEDGRLESSEVSIDQSGHQILQPQIDPIEWKTELERVGPILKANQPLATNEWRAHVDTTVTNKAHIERVLADTQGDLRVMNRYSTDFNCFAFNPRREVTEELNKMRSKEKYMNNQFSLLGQEYREVKLRLEELDAKSKHTTESVSKLTNDLAEVTERLEEMKESFESKDSGIHDTSPLVRIKSALQQIKSEIHAFDMRIGVVAHSVLVARVSSSTRRRIGASKNARRRQQKQRRDIRGGYGDYSGGEDDY